MSQQDLPGFVQEPKDRKQKPVTCLGMTFENDEARRAHFTEELRKKLKDPDFRKTPGFPAGSDEDILRLSDPPFYTACPNPFIGQLIKGHSSNEVHNEMISVFGEDVSGGKHGQIYNVHPYHTKVPPEAIEPLISHYTRPGDVILDPFAGTGMTGVAVTSINKKERTEPRKCILIDLGPAATFIAANYNSITSPVGIGKAFDKLIDSLKQEFGELYSTAHAGWPAQTFSESDANHHVSHLKSQIRSTMGIVEYVVWSEIYSCPHCTSEFSYWNAAVRFFECKVEDSFPCPGCNTVLTKSEPDRVVETYFDTLTQSPTQRTKREPVLISYRVGKRRFEKQPDESDLKKIKQSDGLPLNAPVAPMLGVGGQWGDTWRAGVHAGITHAHHFFSARTLAVLGRFAQKAPYVSLLFALTATAYRLSRLNRYMPQHRNNRSREVVGPLSGTLYVPTLSLEVNPISYLESKRSAMTRVWGQRNFDSPATFCSTQSSESLKDIPDDSVDYVFLDPPFGDNLFYSELSFLWEAWLGVTTSRRHEAVVSPATNKSLRDYTDVMTSALSECYRVLKPGRWMTMEFHNSKNAVWSSIVEAIQLAGFCIADVSILDKKKGTTKQLSYSNTVNKDLIISAYKTAEDTAEEAKSNQDADQKYVWTWVREHLRALHTPEVRQGKLIPNPERQSDLLFDRMVAYHVARGWDVPLSAPEFYAGLTERFPRRDLMYFLPDQVGSYEKSRAKVVELQQLSLFVFDEASAVQWVRQQLQNKPQTFQELQPQFMQHLQSWAKHEKNIELREILSLNYLCYDGKTLVPEQIHAYLSTNWKELRNLPKDDPTLVAKARDRWYVPDPNKAGDLEKLREKALLKEFEEYKEVKKKLKVFRLEAVRAGFKKAWQEHDYAVIVAVADKIPNNVLEEDPKLLMWYDQAVTRMGDDNEGRLS